MRIRDEKKVAKIKQNAVDIIVKDGLDRFSMQKLAKAAEVSPATIYIYFKDRDDLIITLAIEAFDRMSMATLKNFNPNMPFAEGLTIQWKNRAAYWIANPTEGQFLENIRHSTYHAKIFPVAQKKFSELMHTFVRGSIERKELVSLPVEVYWSIAFSPLYQLVKFHQSPDGMFGREKFELTEAMMYKALQLVIKALKP